MLIRALGVVVIGSLACSSTPTANDAGADAAPDVQKKTVDSGPVPDTGGGCDPETAQLEGTFLGNTLTPVDAISFQSATRAAVVITDFSGACALGNDLKANSNVLSLVYSGTAPLASGDIALPSSTLDVQYAKVDATCGSPQGESPTGGTVTIASVDACGISGSFSLTFSGGDFVTGSFTAPACANAPDGGTSACK